MAISWTDKVVRTLVVHDAATQLSVRDATHEDLRAAGYERRGDADELIAGLEAERDELRKDLDGLRSIASSHAHDLSSLSRLLGIHDAPDYEVMLDAIRTLQRTAIRLEEHKSLPAGVPADVWINVYLDRGSISGFATHRTPHKATKNSCSGAVASQHYIHASVAATREREARDKELAKALTMSETLNLVRKIMCEGRSDDATLRLINAALYRPIQDDKP